MTHHVPTADEAVKTREEEVAGHTESHGHSTAAWAAVGLCLFGSLVGCFGLVFGWDYWWMTAVGLLLMALSGPLALVLSRLGHGAQQHSGGPAHQSKRIR